MCSEFLRSGFIFCIFFLLGRCPGISCHHSGCAGKQVPRGQSVSLPGASPSVAHLLPPQRRGSVVPAPQTLRSARARFVPNEPACFGRPPCAYPTLSAKDPEPSEIGRASC